MKIEYKPKGPAVASGWNVHIQQGLKIPVLLPDFTLGQ